MNILMTHMFRSAWNRSVWREELQQSNNVKHNRWNWLGVKCDRCLLTSDIVLVSSWYGLFEKMSLRTSKLASITSMLFDRSLLGIFNET